MSARLDDYLVLASGDRSFENALIGGLIVVCIFLPLAGLVWLWLRNR